METTRQIAEERYWREVGIHGRHNVTMHLVQGAVAIFAMTAFMPETVLAAYMTTMTDSKFLIGLPAAVAGFAWSFPALFYSYVIQRHKQRKEVALRVGSLVRFAFLAMAASAWLGVRFGPAAGIAFFFAAQMLMAGTAGGSAMAWQDFIGRTLPPAKRGFFFGLRESMAGLAGLAASLLLSWYLAGRGDSPGDYLLPLTTGALLYFASWYVLTLVREPEWPGEPVAKGSWRQYYRETFRILVDDRNFRAYILARCLLAVTMIFNVALFASYAKNDFGISPALVAGVFSAVNLFGRTISGPVAGRIADKVGFKAPLLAGVTMMAMALVIGLCLKFMGAFALAGFIAIYFLYGAQGSVIWVATFNLQLEFSRVEDRPRYIALSSTLSSPVFLVAAASSGWLVDRFHYRPVMGAALVVAAAVWLTVFFTFKDPRKARLQRI